MATLVSAPLPDVDLRAASIVTVDTGDPAAIVTELVIHVSQDVPELPPVFPEVPVVFALEAGDGTESPGLTG